MTTPAFPKIIKATFTGAATSDPVTITNVTTGESATTNHKGNTLRLESKHKSIIYDLDNLPNGWSVGDVIVVSIGGTKAGLNTITLTADTNKEQTSSTTATTVSTAVLTI